MKLPIFQVDAFTARLFGGNPASVCPLETWLPDDTLQLIAIENNQAETAFFRPLENGNFHLRWFTPEIEMDLCGHATLAAAHVLFEELGYAGERIIFETQSGDLLVRKENEFLELDFPARAPEKATLPDVIRRSLNIPPLEVWKARDYLLVYEKEEDILHIDPNIALMNEINIDPGGVIVTARGKEVDFVSRFFTPQAVIFEDPVTGSAHCSLVPFWAERLGKTQLHARQISRRGGELFCRVAKGRVYMKGRAITYLQGTIHI